MAGIKELIVKLRVVGVDTALKNIREVSAAAKNISSTPTGSAAKAQLGTLTSTLDRYKDIYRQDRINAVQFKRSTNEKISDGKRVLSALSQEEALRVKLKANELARYKTLQTQMGSQLRGSMGEDSSLSGIVKRHREFKKTVDRLRGGGALYTPGTTSSSGRPPKGVGNMARQIQMPAGMLDAKAWESFQNGGHIAFKTAISDANLASMKFRQLKIPLDHLGTSMSAIGKNASQAGRQITFGLTMPLVMAARKATQLYLSVSAEMTRINKVAGNAAYQPQKANVASDISGMVTQFGISQKAAASLTADMVAMGYSIKGVNSDAHTMAKEIMYTATLGDIGVGTATTFYRSMMKVFVSPMPGVKGFQEEIKGTNFVIDQLNQIENKSSINLNQLADAMPTAAGAAKLFGLGAAELGSVLAGVYDKGMDVNTAATGLNFTLTRMMAPTKKAQVGFAKAFGGDSLAKVQTMAGGMSKLVNMSEKFQELRDRGGKKGEGANRTQATEVFGDLVSKRQIKTWSFTAESINNGLDQIRTTISDLSKGSEATAKNMKDILSANNIDPNVDLTKLSYEQLQPLMLEYKNELLSSSTVSEGFARSLVGSAAWMNENSKGAKKLTKDISDMSAAEISIKLKSPTVQWQVLQQSMKMLAAQLGESLFPILIRVGNILLKVFKRFNDINPSIRTLVVGILALISAFGPAMMAFGFFQSGMGSIITIAAKLLPGLNLLTEAQVALRIATGGSVAGLAVYGDQIIDLDKSGSKLTKTLLGMAGITEGNYLPTGEGNVPGAPGFQGSPAPPGGPTPSTIATDINTTATEENTAALLELALEMAKPAGVAWQKDHPNYSTPFPDEMDQIRKLNKEIELADATNGGDRRAGKVKGTRGQRIEFDRLKGASHEEAILEQQRIQARDGDGGFPTPGPWQTDDAAHKKYIDDKKEWDRAVEKAAKDKFKADKKIWEDAVKADKAAKDLADKAAKDAKDLADKAAKAAQDAADKAAKDAADAAAVIQAEHDKIYSPTNVQRGDDADNYRMRQSIPAGNLSNADNAARDRFYNDYDTSIDEAGAHNDIINDKKKKARDAEIARLKKEATEENDAIDAQKKADRDRQFGNRPSQTERGNEWDKKYDQSFDDATAENNERKKEAKRLERNAKARAETARKNAEKVAAAEKAAAEQAAADKAAAPAGTVADAGTAPTKEATKDTVKHTVATDADAEATKKSTKDKVKNTVATESNNDATNTSSESNSEHTVTIKVENEVIEEQNHLLEENIVLKEASADAGTPSKPQPGRKKSVTDGHWIQDEPAVDVPVVGDKKPSAAVIDSAFAENAHYDRKKELHDILMSNDEKHYSTKSLDDQDAILEKALRTDTGRISKRKFTGDNGVVNTAVRLSRPDGTGVRNIPRPPQVDNPIDTWSTGTVEKGNIRITKHDIASEEYDREFNRLKIKADEAAGLLNDDAAMLESEKNFRELDRQDLLRTKPKGHGGPGSSKGTMAELLARRAEARRKAYEADIEAFDFHVAQRNAVPMDPVDEVADAASLAPDGPVARNAELIANPVKTPALSPEAVESNKRLRTSRAQFDDDMRKAKGQSWFIPRDDGVTPLEVEKRKLEDTFIESLADDDDAQLTAMDDILTERQRRDPHHKGQIRFPGKERTGEHIKEIKDTIAKQKDETIAAAEKFRGQELAYNESRFDDDQSDSISKTERKKREAALRKAYKDSEAAAVLEDKKHPKVTTPTGRRGKNADTQLAKLAKVRADKLETDIAALPPIKLSKAELAARAEQRVRDFEEGEERRNDLLIKDQNSAANVQRLKDEQHALTQKELAKAATAREGEISPGVRESATARRARLAKLTTQERIAAEAAEKDGRIARARQSSKGVHPLDEPYPTHKPVKNKKGTYDLVRMTDEDRAAERMRRLQRSSDDSLTQAELDEKWPVADLEEEKPKKKRAGKKTPKVTEPVISEPEVVEESKRDRRNRLARERRARTKGSKMVGRISDEDARIDAMSEEEWGRYVAQQNAALDLETANTAAIVESTAAKNAQAAATEGVTAATATTVTAKEAEVVATESVTAATVESTVAKEADATVGKSAGKTSRSRSAAGKVINAIKSKNADQTGAASMAMLTPPTAATTMATTAVPTAAVTMATTAAPAAASIVPPSGPPTPRSPVGSLKAYLAQKRGYRYRWGELNAHRMDLPDRITANNNLPGFGGGFDTPDDEAANMWATQDPRGQRKPHRYKRALARSVRKSRIVSSIPVGRYLAQLDHGVDQDTTLSASRKINMSIKQSLLHTSKRIHNLGKVQKDVARSLDIGLRKMASDARREAISATVAARSAVDTYNASIPQAIEDAVNKARGAVQSLPGYGVPNKRNKKFNTPAYRAAFAKAQDEAGEAARAEATAKFTQSPYAPTVSPAYKKWKLFGALRNNAGEKVASGRLLHSIENQAVASKSISGLMASSARTALAPLAGGFAVFGTIWKQTIGRGAKSLLKTMVGSRVGPDDAISTIRERIAAGRGGLVGKVSRQGASALFGKKDVGGDLAGMFVHSPEFMEKNAGRFNPIRRSHEGLVNRAKVIGKDARDSFSRAQKGKGLIPWKLSNSISDSIGTSMDDKNGFITSKLGKLPKLQQLSMKARGGARVVKGVVGGGAGGAYSAVGQGAQMLTKFTSALGPMMMIAGAAITIIALLAALAVAVYLIYKNWDKVYKGMKPGITALKKAFGTLMEAFKGVGKVFTDTFAKAGMGGRRAAGDIGTPFEALGKVMGDFLKAIGAIVTAFASLLGKMTPVFSWMASVMIPMFRFLSSSLQGIAALFSGDLVTAADKFKDALRALIEYITQLARPFFFLIDAIVKGFSYAIASILQIASHLPIVGKMFGRMADSVNAFGESFNSLKWVNKELDHLFGKRKLGKLTYVVDVIEGDVVKKKRKDKNVKSKDPASNTNDSGENKDSSGSKNNNFLAELKTQLEKMISVLREMVNKEFEDVWKARLKVFDDQIKAIDDLEKKEEELLATQEYMQQRRDAMNKRALDAENYRRNRTLAIYEGRIDDARNMDMDFSETNKNNTKAIVDLDSNRGRVLLKKQRDAERERINVAKSAAEERKQIESEALQKQLDALTEFTPKNQQEWEKMMDGINTALVSYGLPKIEGAWNNGLAIFQLGIQKTKFSILDSSFWSGEWIDTSIYAWIAKLAGMPISELINAANKAGSAVKDGFTAGVEGEDTAMATESGDNATAEGTSPNEARRARIDAIKGYGAAVAAERDPKKKEAKKKLAMEAWKGMSDADTKALKAGGSYDDIFKQFASDTGLNAEDRRNLNPDVVGSFAGPNAGNTTAAGHQRAREGNPFAGAMGADGKPIDPNSVRALMNKIRNNKMLGLMEPQSKAQLDAVNAMNVWLKETGKKQVTGKTSREDRASAVQAYLDFTMPNVINAKTMSMDTNEFDPGVGWVNKFKLEGTDEQQSTLHGWQTSDKARKKKNSALTASARGDQLGGQRMASKFKKNIAFKGLQYNQQGMLKTIGSKGMAALNKWESDPNNLAMLTRMERNMPAYMRGNNLGRQLAGEEIAKYGHILNDEERKTLGIGNIEQQMATQISSDSAFVQGDKNNVNYKEGAGVNDVGQATQVPIDPTTGKPIPGARPGVKPVSLKHQRGISYTPYQKPVLPKGFEHVDNTRRVATGKKKDGKMVFNYQVKNDAGEFVTKFTGTSEEKKDRNQTFGRGSKSLFGLGKNKDLSEFNEQVKLDKKTNTGNEGKKKTLVADARKYLGSIYPAATGVMAKFNKMTSMDDQIEYATQMGWKAGMGGISKKSDTTPTSSKSSKQKDKYSKNKTAAQEKRSKFNKGKKASNFNKLAQDALNYLQSNWDTLTNLTDEDKLQLESDLIANATNGTMISDENKNLLKVTGYTKGSGGVAGVNAKTTGNTGTKGKIKKGDLDKNGNLKSKKSRQHKLGSDLGKGIIAGIDSQQKASQEAMIKLIEESLKSAENKAEIKSPSKLFSRKVGKPISHGVAKGISAPSSLKVMADALDELISSLVNNPIVGKANDTVGKPIVDNIAKGVKSPSSLENIAAAFKIVFDSIISNPAIALFNNTVGKPIVDSLALGIKSKSSRKAIADAFTALFSRGDGLYAGIDNVRAVLESMIGAVNISIDGFKAPQLEGWKKFNQMLDAIYSNITQILRGLDFAQGWRSGGTNPDGSEDRFGPNEQKLRQDSDRQFGRFNIRQFATGGLVSSRPGGMIAQIGEGRHDEAVIPLPQGLKNFVSSFKTGGDNRKLESLLVKAMAVSYNAGANAGSSSNTNTTHIYVDNFIGEDEWFKTMMKEYGIKVAPKTQQAYGTINRTVSSYQDNANRTGRV